MSAPQSPRRNSGDRVVRWVEASGYDQLLPHDGAMAMITFSTDPRSERALAELTADGSTTSEAIRQALLDSVRLRRRGQMRRESVEAAQDPHDLAESRAVAQEMARRRVW
ncbi:MAG: hypothetical protein ACRCY8_18465 [Dermatophilaceae bacterium]